jgi:hypothetical protein
MNAGDGNVNVIRLGYVAGTDYSRNAMLNGDGNSWVGAGEGGSKMFTDFINNGAVSGTKLTQLASASESTVFVSDSGYAYLVVGAQNYQSGNYDGISVWQFGTSNLTNPAGNTLAVDNTVVHKTSSEEVTGYKNFSGGMKTNNADIETYLDMIGDGETGAYSVRHKVTAAGNGDYPSVIPNTVLYTASGYQYHRTWELPFVSDATNTVNIDNLIGNGSVVFSSKYVAGTLPTGFSGWGNLTFGHANSGSSNNRYQLLHDTHGYNTYVRYMDAGTWLAWQQLATVNDTGWLDLPLASGVTGTARYRIINDEVKIQIYNVSGITGTSITTGLISNLPFGVAKTGYFTGVIGNATVGVAITDQEQLYVYKTLNGSFSATDTARISFSWPIN